MWLWNPKFTSTFRSVPWKHKWKNTNKSRFDLKNNAYAFLCLWLIRNANKTIIWSQCSQSINWSKYSMNEGCVWHFRSKYVWLGKCGVPFSHSGDLSCFCLLPDTKTEECNNNDEICRPFTSILSLRKRYDSQSSWLDYRLPNKW